MLRFPNSNHMSALNLLLQGLIARMEIDQNVKKQMPKFDFCCDFLKIHLIFSSCFRTNVVTCELCRSTLKEAH